MNLVHKLKHVVEQPFVFATGLAALVHSTWSLGTLFSGEQPEAALTVHFIGWIVPALLIAFALDIGQISTSQEIREDGLTVSRGLTFVVFAVATYYLQWLYMAHHMPALPLSEGVTGKVWTDFAINLRDAGIWLVPSLLPLSTILYTFSSKRTTTPPVSIVETKAVATYPTMQQPQQVEVKELPTVPLSALPQTIHANGNGKHAKGSVNGVGKNYRKKHDETKDSATPDVESPTE